MLEQYTTEKSSSNFSKPSWANAVILLSNGHFFWGRSCGASNLKAGVIKNRYINANFFDENYDNSIVLDENADSLLHIESYLEDNTLKYSTLLLDRVFDLEFFTKNYSELIKNLNQQQKQIIFSLDTKKIKSLLLEAKKNKQLVMAITFCSDGLPIELEALFSMFSLMPPVSDQALLNKSNKNGKGHRNKEENSNNVLPFICPINLSEKDNIIFQVTNNAINNLSFINTVWKDNLILYPVYTKQEYIKDILSQDNDLTDGIYMFSSGVVKRLSDNRLETLLVDLFVNSKQGEFDSYIVYTYSSARLFFSRTLINVVFNIALTDDEQGINVNSLVDIVEQISNNLFKINSENNSFYFLGLRSYLESMKLRGLPKNAFDLDLIKSLGLSDSQLAGLCENNLVVTKYRRFILNVAPSFKQLTKGYFITSYSSDGLNKADGDEKILLNFQANNNKVMIVIDEWNDYFTASYIDSILTSHHNDEIIVLTDNLLAINYVRSREYRVIVGKCNYETILDSSKMLCSASKDTYVYQNGIEKQQELLTELQKLEINVNKNLSKIFN